MTDKQLTAAFNSICITLTFTNASHARFIIRKTACLHVVCKLAMLQEGMYTIHGGGGGGGGGGGREHA